MSERAAVELIEIIIYPLLAFSESASQKPEQSEKLKK